MRPLIPGYLAFLIIAAGVQAAVPFSWDDIPELTTCEPGTFTWRYRGSATRDETALSITNLGVPSNDPDLLFSALLSAEPSPSTTQRRSTPANITQQLSGAVHASDESFSWPTVALPAGRYVLLAVFPQWNAVKQSAAFRVVNGSDTSCIEAPLQVGTSTISILVGPTNDPTPSGGVHGDTRVPVGAIAGVTIGGLVLIGIVGGFFLRRRRRGSGAHKTIDERLRAVADTYPGGGGRANSTLQPNSQRTSSSFGPMVPRQSSEHNLVDEQVLRRYTRVPAPEMAMSPFADPPRTMSPLPQEARAQTSPDSTATVYNTISGEGAPASASVSPTSPAYPSGTSVLLRQLDLEAEAEAEYNRVDPVLPRRSVLG